jgi:microcystin degradation protein MlrC
VKLFIAGLHTESNTFSPIPTGRESFEEGLLAHGDATCRPLNYCSIQLDVWRRLGEVRGGTVIESLCAFAEPGGKTSRSVYEDFRAEILADLRAAGEVDCILLSLHGAMVADGYDDVEGDLLTHIRAQTGPDVPIGAELDLHCHLTEQMLGAATAFVLYKEYPHTDIEERASEVFNIVVDAAAGHSRPVMAMFDCRMVGLYRTQEQPMRAFVDRLKALEGRNGILSVSFGHGFPWGDVADVGAKMLVVADKDRPKAKQLADSLGLEVYAMRNSLAQSFLSIDDALDRALASEAGPVILADAADNAGGGAPGDSTFIIRRIIDRGIRNVASALYWDPVAVRHCREAGEGATLDLRIGGKVGVASGWPVDFRVTVRRVASGITQRYGQVSLPIGDAVWVHADGIDLVLNTQRTQVFHPECMTSLGIDLSQRAIVVVKSINHFYAGFAPMAKEILFVDAPGALQRHFEDIPYTKVTRPFWPRDDDPLDI